MKKLHKTAIGILRQYTKKVSFNNVLGIQAEIEKELVRLLLAWIPDPEQKRVVLFVDDLDRCSQEKIIELVDSLRVMLDNNEIIKRLIVICACDEHKISMGIKYKYRDYCSSSQESDHIICEYLDKIFISGIKLPEISKEDAYEFVDKLMMCDNLTEPLVKVDGEVTPTSVDVKLSFFQRISKSLKQFMQRVHFIKEDTTIKVQNESKDVGENRNEIQNMSFGETNKLIKEQIALFKPCLTPRQIRILYYRYRLGHNLYIALTKQNLMDHGELLRGIGLITRGEQLESMEDETLKLVINIVVAYTCK